MYKFVAMKATMLLRAGTIHQNGGWRQMPKKNKKFGLVAFGAVCSIQKVDSDKLIKK